MYAQSGNLLDVGVVAVRREDQNPRARGSQLENSAGCLQPVEMGHRQVQNGDVGAQILGHLHGLQTIGGLPDHVDVLFHRQKRAEPLSDNGVVVGQHHGDALHGRPPRVDVLCRREADGLKGGHRLSPVGASMRNRSDREGANYRRSASGHASNTQAPCAVSGQATAAHRRPSPAATAACGWRVRLCEGVWFGPTVSSRARPVRQYRWWARLAPAFDKEPVRSARPCIRLSAWIHGGSGWELDSRSVAPVPVGRSQVRPLGLPSRVAAGVAGLGLRGRRGFGFMVGSSLGVGASLLYRPYPPSCLWGIALPFPQAWANRGCRNASCAVLPGRRYQGKCVWGSYPMRWWGFPPQ